ncbi:hypothetical protein Tco_0316010 [Tanacetum coccineum]
MLILLVQRKLTNLNVEDRLAFGVSLRMFTRSIVIQRRVKDLQLGVESYQKKLNITKPDTYRSDLKFQPWLSNLAQEEGPRESFDELMDTPLDFLAFMMNQLKIDTLTPELLAGLKFELMKGQQYPHDLQKPLPLIPNSCSRQAIPFDHFINNDLAYLSSGVSSRTYETSVTKTKAAEVMVISNRLKIWPLTQSGVKCQSTMTSMHYGESLIGDTNVNNSINLLLTGNLLMISTLNAESLISQSFKLSNGMATNIWIGSPFLTNLNVEDHLAFGVSLRMFTRSIVIQRDAYTTYSNPRGFIYQNKDKKNKLMRIDELYKFSDGTLDEV